jgi:hypothetical protein
MAMRKIALIAVICVLGVMVLGCGVRGAAPTAPVERGADVSVELPLAAPAPEPVTEESYAAGGVWQANIEPMIVRTADLTIVVEDTEQALEAIEGLASELDGYISQSRSWRVDDQLAATITVRVPSDAFDEARDRIKALATEVESENISGTDVTEEYVDLEARLKNLQVAEAELLELLASAQETRQDAEQILAIYREVTNIRGQIEQIQGRMKYLENVASLATLTVTLNPQEVEEPVVEPGWDPLRIARDALRSLVEAMKLIAGLLIWLGVFVLPIVALFAMPFVFVWLGWFLWRRRRKRARGS